VRYFYFIKFLLIQVYYINNFIVQNLVLISVLKMSKMLGRNRIYLNWITLCLCWVIGRIWFWSLPIPDTFPSLFTVKTLFFKGPTSTNAADEGYEGDRVASLRGEEGVPNIWNHAIRDLHSDLTHQERSRCMKK